MCGHHEVDGRSKSSTVLLFIQSSVQSLQRLSMNAPTSQLTRSQKEKEKGGGRDGLLIGIRIVATR